MALAHSHSSLAGLWWQKPNADRFMVPPRAAPFLASTNCGRIAPFRSGGPGWAAPYFRGYITAHVIHCCGPDGCPWQPVPQAPRGALRVGRPAFAKSGPQPPVPKTACVGNREGRSHSGEPPAGWDARGFTPLPERACGNVGADVVGESPNGRPWTPPPQAGAWMTPGAKNPRGPPPPVDKTPRSCVTAA